MAFYIENFNECTDPTTGDFMWIVDASAGSTDKDRKVNISRFAILANLNTFTATQTIAPSSTSVNALTLNMPSSTSGNVLDYQYNGASRIAVQILSNMSRIFYSAFDNGSAEGGYILLNRNSNVSTPAAGFVGMSNRAGSAYYVWPDASGNLRIHTSTPTNANDGAGTVVGSQSSSRDVKNVLGEFTEDDEALNEIAKTPLYRFTYKDGQFNNQEFVGIITDESPIFGVDRDEKHPAGKSLNEITAHGYEMAAIKALTRKVFALETLVSPLLQQSK